jgi:hypothetical protein
MDNNYLYIIGFLGIILVSFVFYYFLKNRSKNQYLELNNDNNNYNNSKNIDSGKEVECDGDKCYIRPKLKIYEKCDDQNPL